MKFRWCFMKLRWCFMKIRRCFMKIRKVDPAARNLEVKIRSLISLYQLLNGVVIVFEIPYALALNSLSLPSHFLPSLTLSQSATTH